MSGRAFIRLLGGAAIAWLHGLAARVQGRRVRLIGDLEWMIRIATVLCAFMVLVFSSESSAAQQSGIPAERYYSPPERYALEHCRPEPYTSESLVGSGPTREEYMGFPPWAAWKKIPSITVVSTEDDPRLPAVREAVDFWNGELSKLASPFRLGAVVHITGVIPVGDLYALRPDLLSRDGRPAPACNFRPALADSIWRVKGDVVVALSDARLNSFTFGGPVVQKVVAAIQSNRTYPLAVPNGARNVIAHELGHVIGLRHSDDAGSLMCSRAACHWPFPSEGFFPLTAIEKEKLLEMYPRGWRTAATQRHIVTSTKRR
jgi:hypothetical protein